ncbi:MAG: 2-oxoacid:acceptor oxidoreductase subunit alpha [Thermoprotei archaeon]|nr:MAG: 2-oxoacid:acceptor oxidoreductase subunit alpha [Thermoprotei archaeon]RLE99276.1 MAG: 2-oxoacid:acceptor oxidoreductase subunit alpha [Thermoprotei archaeon]
MTEKVELVHGDHACAMAAIDAGCRFFAGYPITPSTEIAEYMAKELPKVGGVFIQFEDELGSIMAVLGASWAGLKAMTATSGPGICLMAEAIGFAAMTETPCVIVDVQRAGPATGAATRPWQGDLQQVRWLSSGDYEIIALYPWSVQETYFLTVEAFNLAETYRVPVFLLLDAVIGHMRERLVIPPKDKIKIVNRPKPLGDPKALRKTFKPYAPDPETLVPPMACFGEGWRTRCETSAHDERGLPADNRPDIHGALVKRLCDKIRRNYEKIVKWDSIFSEDCDYLIISAGFMARICKAAALELRNEGVKIGVFRPVTIWPFPERELEEVCKRVKKVFVVEMNYGQIYREVTRVRKDAELIPWLNYEPPTPHEIVELVRDRI